MEDLRGIGLLDDDDNDEDDDKDDDNDLDDEDDDDEDSDDDGDNDDIDDGDMGGGVRAVLAGWCVHLQPQLPEQLRR